MAECVAVKASAWRRALWLALGRDGRGCELAGGLGTSHVTGRERILVRRSSRDSQTLYDRRLLLILAPVLLLATALLSALIVGGATATGSGTKGRLAKRQLDTTGAQAQNYVRELTLSLPSSPLPSAASS